VYFDLGLLGPAFGRRADAWDELALTVEPASPPSATAKPSSELTFKSAHYLGNFVLWVSGEGEATVVRLRDGRRMVKVYRLTSPAALDGAIGELIAFMVDGEVPTGGHLWDR
jgi:hypothetical protein